MKEPIYRLIKIEGRPERIAALIENVVYAMGEDDSSPIFMRRGEGLTEAYKAVSSIGKTISDGIEDHFYLIPFKSSDGTRSVGMLVSTEPAGSKVRVKVELAGTTEERDYMSEELHEWAKAEPEIDFLE